jgi:hypothetical protein
VVPFATQRVSQRTLAHCDGNTNPVQSVSSRISSSGVSYLRTCEPGCRLRRQGRSRAWQQPRQAGQLRQQLPARLLQLPDTARGKRAQERAQREGARTPPNRSGMAPRRSRSTPSIESAPAAIPATRQATFTSGCTPVSTVIWTWPRTRACGPARSARDMTGTSPVRDTRFGSSKHARVFIGSCDNRILQVPSEPAGRSFSNSHRPSSGALSVLPRRARARFVRWIEAHASGIHQDRRAVTRSVTPPPLKIFSAQVLGEVAFGQVGQGSFQVLLANPRRSQGRSRNQYFARSM